MGGGKQQPLKVASSLAGNKMSVSMGVRRYGIMWVHMTDMSGNVLCSAESGRNSELFSGLWNQVAFVLRTEPLRPWTAASVVFFVNGGVASAVCTSSTADGPGHAAFSYKQEPYVSELRTMLVGARFNPALRDGGGFEAAYDGALDDIEVFAEALSAGDIALLLQILPCARGFVGKGFAFFER